MENNEERQPSLQDLMSHAKKLDENLEEEAQKQARADAMVEFGLVDKKSGKNAAVYAEIDQLKAEITELKASFAESSRAYESQIVELQAQLASASPPSDIPPQPPMIPPVAPKNPFA